LIRVWGKPKKVVVNCDLFSGAVELRKRFASDSKAILQRFTQQLIESAS
jgi:hypothetical protein